MNSINSILSIEHISEMFANRIVLISGLKETFLNLC